MQVTANDILNLYRDLVPDGRAFRVPFGSTYENFVLALAAEKVTVWDVANNILDVIYADNPNFSLQDAHQWYVRLGIYDSGSVGLSNMIAAINAKYSRLGSPKYRMNQAFIQEQLQATGFNVNVYENRFWNGTNYESRAPYMVLGASAVKAMHGFVGHGQAQHGQLSSDNISLCVNYLEEAKDNTFVIGDNYNNTFFIAGATINAFASVPVARKTEFRQLILSLKQCQGVAILFVNYT